MTESRGRARGGARAERGGDMPVDTGNRDDTAPASATEPRTRHHVWRVRIAGIGELRVVALEGATVDELETAMAQRWPGKLQTAEPVQVAR